MAKKIIVAGAGASGLTAAIAAARSGAEVTVLEAMERPGKKLLMTGNGRCNLTNMDAQLSSRYHGGAELAKTVTERFGARETLQFFVSLGLLTRERDGYVYPYTGQASTVLQVLLAEIRRLRVKLKLSERVQELHRENGQWLIRTGSWQYTADAVVLACGSRCMPETGSDGSGYRLAGALGHTIVRPAPALTPLVCQADFLQAVSGVRCQAQASLFTGDCLLGTERGELQWTKYGVSGIVVFQLSRFVSAAEKQAFLLELDLWPDFTGPVLVSALRERAKALEQERVSACLCGLLHEKLIPVVLRQAGVSAKQTCAQLSDEQTMRIVQCGKRLSLPVKGTRSFDSCQVCAGGVDTGEVSAQDLQSRKQTGLYLAGEMLDVDGPCGGYNLQWAWASGYLAGMSAAAGF